MMRVMRVLHRFAENADKSINFGPKPPVCMILHPVGFPNKGPIIQQFLAEQAVGLAKSLKWEVVPGPYWKGPKKSSPFLPYDRRDKNMLYIQNTSLTEIRDGDYIRTSIGNGRLLVNYVLKKGDGIEFSADESQSDGDLQDQWKNKLLRESLANSSLIKTRRITRKYFFSKGKLDFISTYLAFNPVDCLFVNAELKPGQVRNLKKFIEARMNGLSVARIYYNQEGQSETQYQTEKGEELEKKRRSPDWKKIKIFDRFSVILQIFGQRSTKKLAKLQVQLSYLKYLRTKLVRDGSTYSSNLNVFNGNLMNAEEVQLQIISARQRKAVGSLGGQGQTQLQLQKRSIRDKQAKIRRQIEEQTRLRDISMDKANRRNTSIPVVALVGYTNVGKSALLNKLVKKQEVRSQDLLFQTLSVTSRHVMLPSGRKMMLLDTIGFITNLPTEMVQSFKSTLEEIKHADMVIHLRDASNQMNLLQKETILKVLRELNFEEKFYTERMMEVWNKCDLVTEGEGQSDGIQRISCRTGEGISQFLEAIEQKLRDLASENLYRLEYSLAKHPKVVEWLRENSNVSFRLDTEFDYNSTNDFPQGKAILKVHLDQEIFGKLSNFISPTIKKKDKKQKGMPPKEGW